MLTVAWGNFLTLVPPGFIVLVSLQGHLPLIARLMKDPNALELPGAAYLLIAATLFGGILEALRSITLDRCIPALRGWLRHEPVPPWGVPGKAWLWLLARTKGEPRRARSLGNFYYYLTPQNLEVFQAAVDNSWKYYTFYGNLFLSLICLVLVSLNDTGLTLPPVGASVLAVVVGVAAYWQSASFYGRMEAFVHVEQLARGTLMFEDDPPTGTAIQTMVGALDESTKRSVPSPKRGTLGRRVTGDRGSSGPSDVFEITVDGVTYRVQRQFIGLAPR